MINTKRVTAVVVLLSIALLVPPHAAAISGKSKVVSKGQKAKAMAGWPKGVLALVNDPLRTNGWHPWFSECPNDRYYYAMEVRRPEDVNHLVGILAAIKAEAVQLRLDPAKGASHADGVGAVFTLGNQLIINGWYLRLPEVAPGIRQFGLHRYHKPPTAQPPTLTLYIGHKAVDLKRLTIPTRVDVAAPNAESYRAKHSDAFEAVDAFVKGHAAKQKQAGKHASTED
ncbi:MAG: hypothetical protein ACYTG0_36220 [Planctomycetota bacterium]|jgi:hypothetical protein